jgi:hypothetical protein
MITTSTRRAILDGIAAMPATTLPAFGVASEPDPIYAAIAAHRSAVAAWHEAGGDDRATHLAGDAMDKTGAALAEVQPTTLAGVIAYLSYIAECLGEEGGGWQFPQDDPMLRPFAHFLVRSAAVALEQLV